MASAEQIKALLKSHMDGDDERFFSVAMQVAAHEARVGHGKLAVELRALVDQAKTTRSTRRAVGARQDLLSRARGLPSSLLETSRHTEIPHGVATGSVSLYSLPRPLRRATARLFLQPGGVVKCLRHRQVH